MRRPGRKLQSAAIEEQRSTSVFDLLLLPLSFAQQRVMSPSNLMSARLERAQVKERG